MMQFKNKIVMIGQSGVGKTSIIHTLLNNRFQGEHKKTVGYDFYMKNYIDRNDI